MKTGMLIIGGVKCNFMLGVVTSFTMNLKGSLDDAHWCIRETYQNGNQELTHQTTTAVYEVTVVKQ